MTSLKSTVERLRGHLSQQLDAGDCSPQQIARVQDRVAELLLRALADDEHPVSSGFTELRERSKLEQEGKLYRVTKAPLGTKRRTPPNFHRHLFMPHPGAIDPEARRLWRLQLLLQTAARSAKHGSRLADLLGLTGIEMLRAANEAAAAASVAAWSHTEYLSRLEQAVTILARPEPDVPFQLEGRNFRHVTGVEIRLSPTEAIFLNLLLHNKGRWVTISELKKAGVSYPPQTKTHLVKRLRDNEIDVGIISRTGAYSLPTIHPSVDES